jgi:hypothetical protein
VTKKRELAKFIMFGGFNGPVPETRWVEELISLGCDQDRTLDEGDIKFRLF